MHPHNAMHPLKPRGVHCIKIRVISHNRNIKKICFAKTPILSGFFAAQTPGFGDAYS